jgi:hypothetical protein
MYKNYKNVLIICASEKTYQKGLSRQIIREIFNDSESKEEPIYQFYYVGVDLKPDESYKCQSPIRDMTRKCSNIFNVPNKFDIILSEECPYRGNKSIYDTQLISVLDMFLKPNGLYIALMDKKFKDKIDDIQYSDITLTQWLGSTFYLVDIHIHEHTKQKSLVYQKIQKNQKNINKLRRSSV